MSDACNTLTPMYSTLTTCQLRLKRLLWRRFMLNTLLDTVHHWDRENVRSGYLRNASRLVLKTCSRVECVDHVSSRIFADCTISEWLSETFRSRRWDDHVSSIIVTNQALIRTTRNEKYIVRSIGIIKPHIGLRIYYILICIVRIRHECKIQQDI